MKGICVANSQLHVYIKMKLVRNITILKNLFVEFTATAMPNNIVDLRWHF